MKNILIAAAMILGSAQAFAQNPLTTTQSPPAGGSSESTPNTTTSLPKAAGTETPTNQPGATVGGAAPASPAVGNGVTRAPAGPPASK